MPKNIQDIIPTNRKSIRSIPVPHRRAEPAKEPAPERIALTRLVSEEPEFLPRRHKGKGRKVLIALASLALLAMLAFTLLRSGATLAYTPKTANVAFAGDAYTAVQSASGGQLPYSVIKISGEKSATAPATGDETVSVKASGKVMLYNQQSAPQRLVKTTRLETPEGKIYRIESDVTIPAKGNLEVTAVAAEPGADYNIGLSDFSLPGLKGSPRFEQVYGRSKTSMTGGFTGTRKKVSDTDLAKAKATLEGELRSELLSEARAQMPADYVLFPSLSSISYTLGATEAAGENASVKESADLSAAIFRRSDLAQYLAIQKLGAQNVGSEVEIPDFGKLEAAFAGSAPVDLTRAENIRIQITGIATLRYITDEVALAADLLGIDKRDLDVVLKRYPSISKANATIRPFWKSSFPTDAAKIKIEERS